MTIRYEKLSEKVVERIIKMIDIGSLKTGDKLLNETQFSKELGVSRGILREAFNILEEKGYITRKTGVGTYINNLSSKEKLEHSMRTASYIEMLDAREAIEQKIIDLVIKNSTDEELNEAEKELFIKKPCIKTENINIHLKLAELSKNRILENFVRVYIGMIEEIGERSYLIHGRYKTVEHEHETLYNLIKKRDLLGAQKLLKDHIEAIKKIIKEDQIFILEN